MPKFAIQQCTPNREMYLGIAAEFSVAACTVNGCNRVASPARTGATSTIACGLNSHIARKMSCASLQMIACPSNHYHRDE